MFRHLTIVAVSGALALSACGSDAATQSSAPTPTETIESAVTAQTALEFNAADVQFLQSMIPHHEQADEMADIAADLTYEASETVLELAGRLKAEQRPQINFMNSWLRSSGQATHSETSVGQDMSAMDGTITANEMTSLRALRGTEFDTMWMQMMIRHHQGAIVIAQTVKYSGLNTDVLALADQIIVAKQGEIAEMDTMLSD